MKRYFIVNEFFGLRVYDSLMKSETYFDQKNSPQIKKLLMGEYTEISHDWQCNGNFLGAPLKVSMNLTKRCNLRCKQCFSDSGEVLYPELTTLEVCKLLDDMRENGTFFICLGGGEPLMRNDLLEILRHGKTRQLAISIVSNGLLLTNTYLEELNKMDLDTFWISLDGLEKNHEILRGEGTFKKALNALQLLKDCFVSKKAIRVSLNKYNIGEFKGLIDLAEMYEVDIIRFTPLMSFGRAKNEDLTISQDQYISFLREIQTIKSSVKIIYPNTIDDGKFWISSDDFGCHCGKEAIWIDELGRYSPCFFFGESFFVGNIVNEDYISLWKKSLAVVSLEGNDTCKTCKNYYMCRGGCRARVLDTYGNLNEVDPLCPLKCNP